MRDEASRVRSLHARNWRVLKEQPWQEMSGAFGDLGTFIPIFIALAGEQRLSGSPISVASTLIFSGLANVLTGIFFGIPLPVQPMKAIAAVAIANMGTTSDFGAAELASAGLFVSGCVAFLSMTGLLHVFTRVIPVPVVKGIQVGAGITLAMKSVVMLAPGGATFPFDVGGVFIGGLVLTLLLYVATFAKFPFTLAAVGAFAVLSIINGIVCLAVDYPNLSPYAPWFSIWNPLPFIVPSPPQFVKGAVDAGLGQLPLTTLNSIVAVVYLAEDLFPEVKAPTATTIGMSVAVMNLVGCWFRAMPVCHGSGGLAAQYRFGARSGASIIFLGGIKLVLGLFGSKFALWFCQNFPNLVLALLLFLAGQELVKMGESINSEHARDLWVVQDEEEVPGGSGGSGENTSQRGRKFKTLTQEEKTRRWTVMSATVIALLGAKNDGVGFIVGMVMHGVYTAQDYYMKRWEARTGQIRLEDGREGEHTGSGGRWVSVNTEE